MKPRLLLLFLLPICVFAQKTRFDMNNFKKILIKTDSIKVFTFSKGNAGNTANGDDFNIGNIATKNVITRKLNTRFIDMVKKLNINLNPASPMVEGNYLGCCNCCTETTVKTFSSVGVYSFSSNNNDYSTTSVTINAFANVQYLVRITGSTTQARNFTVSFGSANNKQGYQVLANNFEITFIAKPQKTGNFFFTLYSNEPGLWSFYNCSVTEL